jgi:hypothetical protein
LSRATISVRFIPTPGRDGARTADGEARRHERRPVRPPSSASRVWCWSGRRVSTVRVRPGAHHRRQVWTFGPTSVGPGHPAPRPDGGSWGTSVSLTRPRDRWQPDLGRGGLNPARCRSSTPWTVFPRVTYDGFTGNCQLSWAVRYLGGPRPTPSGEGPRPERRAAVRSLATTGSLASTKTGRPDRVDAAWESP